jgi:hypothetical protein
LAEIVKNHSEIPQGDRVCGNVAANMSRTSLIGEHAGLRVIIVFLRNLMDFRSTTVVNLVTSQFASGETKRKSNKS